MATTRVSLGGPAAAYAGFVAKSAEFIPNVILWTSVAYAHATLATVTYTAPGVTSVEYIPEP